MTCMKRIAALLLAVLMSVCLFGCGKDKKLPDVPYTQNTDPILPGAANPTVVEDVDRKSVV